MQVNSKKQTKTYSTTPYQLTQLLKIIITTHSE